MDQQTPALYEGTDAFRGARIVSSDLTGLTLRDCVINGLKVADVIGDDVYLSGALRRVVVNDVDVTDFVESELDRRHPLRVQVRSMRTPHEYRAAWDAIERAWAATFARYDRLRDEATYERVDDEWSLVETLRHLVFATDAWAARTVLDEEMPYHRLGLPHDGYPRDQALALGVDVGARPTFAEVLAVRRERVALVRRLVAGLDDAELQRPVTRTPGPGYPEQPRTVGSCLSVVMQEECEHNRYITRDLTVLEARLDS
jgi:uncharacterized damage-inducible protein DinB